MYHLPSPDCLPTLHFPNQPRSHQYHTTGGGEDNTFVEQTGGDREESDQALSSYPTPTAAP